MIEPVLCGIGGFLIGTIVTGIYFQTENEWNNNKETWELRHKISHLRTEKKELESELKNQKSTNSWIRKSLDELEYENKNLEETINHIGYELERCHWGGYTLKKNQKGERVNVQ